MASTIVVADDRYTEKALQKLIAALRTAGAAMADRLVVRCVSGTLSIEAPTVRPGAMLIQIPQDCLIPLKAFQLGLANDEIVISSARSRLKSSIVEIAEAMFEIYNLSGKIAQHRQTSPWSLIASHLDLLPYVTPPSRDDFPFSAKDIRSGDDPKVMLASFLHSRVLTHQPSDRARPSSVLVPITDFLNHHWRGAPYSYDRHGAVVMRRSAPLPGKGDECFASYGFHDAYDSWITYGFVDDDVPFVQSLPVTVDLSRVGTIRFGETPLARESDGTEPLPGDLEFYAPRILGRNGNHLKVGAVVIPGPQAPRALRRALRALIGELGVPRQQHRDLVRCAEEQILDANLTYYEELKSCLQGLSVDDDAHSAIRANFIRICDAQVARIRNYLSYAAG